MMNIQGSKLLEARLYSGMDIVYLEFLPCQGLSVCITSPFQNCLVYSSFFLMTPILLTSQCQNLAMMMLDFFSL